MLESKQIGHSKLVSPFMINFGGIIKGDSDKEDENDLIMTHFEQFNLHQFCIAYAYSIQLNNDPVLVILHNSH